MLKLFGIGVKQDQLKLVASFEVILLTRGPLLAAHAIGFFLARRLWNEISV